MTVVAEAAAVATAAAASKGIYQQDAKEAGEKCKLFPWTSLYLGCLWKFLFQSNKKNPSQLYIKANVQISLHMCFYRLVLWGSYVWSC